MHRHLDIRFQVSKQASEQGIQALGTWVRELR